MRIWLDGLSALEGHSWAVFSVLLVIVWGQFVIRKFLVKQFNGQLTDAESLSLGLAGWILPAAVWALAYIVIVILFGAAAGTVFSILLLGLSLYFLVGKTRRIPLPLVGLILFAAISVILHSAFLQKAILPSYFDSAEHYRIARQILEMASTAASPSAPVGQPYYHVGYHLVAAAVSHFFQINILDVMLVFGQIVLATLPLSLFFIVRRETMSYAAGSLSVLLAGFGWHMPSHAVNWGKYPALLSLICIHFVLSLAWMLARNPSDERRAKMALLMGAGMFTSILIHTRSAFVYAGMALAILVTVIWRRSLANIRRLIFGLAALSLVAGIGFVKNEYTLEPLLSGYLQRDAWMLVLALALIPFAIKHHTDASLFIITSQALFFLALFLPITLPGFGVLTILDRPYAQMLAYLPLSLISGLGLSGLLKWISRLFPRSNLPARLTVFSLFGLVIVNASLHHNFYPSDCCQFASRDDLAALTWLDASLPPGATILVASSAFQVTALEPAFAQAGADAGIWIPALTSRAVTLLPHQTQFEQEEARNQLCSLHVDYIYVGGMPQSFDNAQLASRPEWYRRVFALPQAQVYQVIACE